MKVLLFGKFAKNVEGLVKSLGLTVVDKNADVVISYGGDGTLLSAEREYPGIPKLPMRNSQVCNKCTDHEDKVVLQKIQSGKLHLKEYRKLETEILYKKFYALNDFVIRNSDPVHTIRFKINADKLLIGDGIVIATPFGSTGYFKSITDKTFTKAFGVAFNNTTEKVLPLLIKDGASVTFKLIRGQAILAYDNSPDTFLIDEGSELIFKLSDQTAKIYEADALRCPKCTVIRG